MACNDEATSHLVVSNPASSACVHIPQREPASKEEMSDSVTWIWLRVRQFCEKGKGFPIVAYRFFFFSSSSSTRSTDWRIHLRGRYQELCFVSRRDHNWADCVLSDNAQRSLPAWWHIGKGEFSSVHPHVPASGPHPTVLLTIDFSMRPANGVMGFVIIKPPSPCLRFFLIFVCLRILNLFFCSSYAGLRNAYLWICCPIHHQCFIPSLPTPPKGSIMHLCVDIFSPVDELFIWFPKFPQNSNCLHF